MTLPLGRHAQGPDGQVHLVVVGSGPSHRALCGRAVVVVYEHQMGTTCAECARLLWTNRVPVSYEPCG